MIAKELGHSFLTREEQVRAIDLQVGYLYDFLAKQPGRFVTDSEFRRHHVDSLKKYGAPFRVGRLALATLKRAVKTAQRGLMTGSSRASVTR
jgi:hypothetical protein